MFTPQKKGWPSFPRSIEGKNVLLTPSNPRNSRFLVLEKGKGKVVAVAETPPPVVSLGVRGADVAGGDGEVEVWRRFREAGLLDESVLRRKDREALVQRIQELEKELHDYQYNMGLLLIEKEKWASEYEEIRQALVEAEGILKREQIAHMIALSELEKREENIRKALGVEKQCVKDLEKALREMNAEIADAKLTSDKKLAEAHTLEANIEEKYLEIKGKLHSADAKLAEASRRSTEIDIKLEEVEARECRLQKECSSFITEKKAHEEDLARQREDLRAWEQRLLEHQERLVEGQCFLSERENRASENSGGVKKEVLVEEEYDISTRLRTLAAKEKEVDIKQMNLEKKERDLLVMEEKLAARERVEIQRLLDDHNTYLDSKKQEFELELEKKRQSFEEDLNDKVDAGEKKKNEINYREDQVFKKEQALESKMEKLMDKEKEIDTKSRALKEREESIQKDEKKLMDGKEQLTIATQKLVTSKAELESLRSAMDAEEQQIIREKENLKLLQAELKQDIDDGRIMKESLTKETEDLRQEKNKFEREWEGLDERRMALAAELKQLNEDKERFKEWRHIEEEKLKNESMEVRVDIQQELEELRLKKEAFEKEHADFARELESSMQRKLEEMEEKMQEKENEFERRMEMEQNRIKFSSNFDESKILKLKMDQDGLAREKEELSVQRRKLETDQLVIQKDMDALQKNLENEREEFIKEREHFLAVSEQCKICRHCGVTVSELDFLGLQTPLDFLGLQTPSKTEVAGNILLEEHMDGSQSVPSGGHMASLRKCSMLFNSYPGKRAEHPFKGRDSKSILLDREASEGEIDYGHHRDQSDSGVRGSGVSERLDKAGDEPEPSCGIADASIREMEGELNISSIDEQNKRDEDDSWTLPAKQRGQRHSGRRGRPKIIKRTYSVKAVVEDAKAILQEISKEKEQQTNEGTENLMHIDEVSRGDLVHGDRMATSAGQRWHFGCASGVATGKLDSEDGEAPSENVSVGGRRKRRQTSAPETPATGEKRYNFRLSTIRNSRNRT